MVSVTDTMQHSKCFNNIHKYTMIKYIIGEILEVIFPQRIIFHPWEFWRRETARV